MNMFNFLFLLHKTDSKTLVCIQSGLGVAPGHQIAVSVVPHFRPNDLVICLLISGLMCNDVYMPYIVQYQHWRDYI